MSTGRRSSERSTRRRLCSPGRPPVGQRENLCRFWRAVASGSPSEEAGVIAAGGRFEFAAAKRDVIFALQTVNGECQELIEIMRRHLKQATTPPLSVRTTTRSRRIAASAVSSATSTLAGFRTCASLIPSPIIIMPPCSLMDRMRPSSHREGVVGRTLCTVLENCIMAEDVRGPIPKAIGTR